MSQSHVISIIYDKLESENSLAHHVGSRYNLVKIHPRRPEVYISTINSTSNPCGYEYIKSDVGPYNELPLAHPVQTSGNQGSSTTIQYLTSLLQNKDDRIEVARLKYVVLN